MCFGSYLDGITILFVAFQLFNFSFNDPQNVNALKNKIGNLPHIQGGTRTDRALELAGEDFFGWVESGDRPEKPNVLIVLTDGDTNEGSRPFPEVLPPLEVLTLLVEVYFEQQSISLFINRSVNRPKRVLVQSHCCVGFT